MKTLRLRKILDEDARKLIAVESVESTQSKTDTGGRFFGSIKPIALVVCDPRGSYALDIEARTADLEQLRRDLPELDALVEQFN